MKNFDCSEIFGVALFFFFFFVCLCVCGGALTFFGHMLFGCEQFLVMWVLVVEIFLDT